MANAQTFTKTAAVDDACRRLELVREQLVRASKWLEATTEVPAGSSPWAYNVLEVAESLRSEAGRLVSIAAKLELELDRR